MTSTAYGTPLSLLEALKKLRIDDRVADVILVCNGGEVKAHRAILSCRSIYFQKMFTNNFKESQTGHVNFPNIDCDVMHTILDFIYYDSTDKIKKENLNHVIQVHQSSHLFEIQGLTNRCWELIMTSLHIDNALDIWNIVLVYGDETELAIILQFVLKNLETIMKTDKFVALDTTGFKSLMEEIKGNSIALTDTILAGIIKWCKRNPGQHFYAEEFLGNLNYDYVSKDYMKQLLENERSLFTEKFYKQFCISRLFLQCTAKDETTKAKLNAIMMARKYKQPLKFLYFSCYVKVVNGCLLNEKVILKITDLHDEANDHVIREQLPFLIKDDFIPILDDDNIFFIGAFPLTYPQENAIFITYNWKTNSSSVKSITNIPIQRRLYTAVVDHEIYFVEGVWNKIGIHSYNIFLNKWTTINVDLPNHGVVGCVNLRESLYLCILENKNYSLYKFSGHKMIRICNVPIEYYSGITSQTTVIVNEDKLFVFSFTNSNYYSAYAVFNPDNLQWKTNKLIFPMEGSEAPFEVFSNLCGSIYFYSSSTNKLFIFQEIDDSTGTIKEFMGYKKSLSSEARLVERGYKKVTKFISSNQLF